MSNNNINSFLALAFRMKHINRWNLMFNMQNENLSQHSLECAFVSHFLALIGNEYFNKSYNTNKIIICALYHDIAEVFTGDIATPVKYYSDKIKNDFKKLEKKGLETIIDSLPDEIRSSYSGYIYQTLLNEEEKKLLKVADKICAYIKCETEYNLGNNEFKHIRISVLEEIQKMNSEEADYLIKNCIDSFDFN